MPSDDDWLELADRMSTWTLDLALPNESVKWGHLSPRSCVLLAECVKQWMKDLPELIDGTESAE